MLLEVEGAFRPICTARRYSVESLLLVNAVSLADLTSLLVARMGCQSLVQMPFWTEIQAVRSFVWPARQHKLFCAKKVLTPLAVLHHTSLPSN